MTDEENNAAPISAISQPLIHLVQRHARACGRNLNVQEFDDAVTRLVDVVDADPILRREALHSFMWSMLHHYCRELNGGS